jgi:hypothetical protein
MAEDMTPLAIVEREPRLEGKNMFMILAPRATPTGPPKYSTTREKEQKPTVVETVPEEQTSA